VCGGGGGGVLFFLEKGRGVFCFVGGGGGGGAGYSSIENKEWVFLVCRFFSLGPPSGFTDAGTIVQLL